MILRYSPRGSLGAVVALLLLALTAAAAPLQLVVDGRSAYKIVVAPDASPSERHGAAELQKFLEEISGARLPIASETGPAMILVGRGPALDALKPGIRFDDLGAEGFALKTQGPHIIIAGGRLRGTMYGVYEFLEKLGCRWFAPQVSRIPKHRTLVVPALDETQKPSFEAREPFFPEAADPDWAARNKANGQSMRLDEARGGKLRQYPGGHSFFRLVPPQKYFKDHPEYYSLVDGKRRIDTEHSQLCLTNPDVLRISIQTVERWIAEHPQITHFSVSQNDGDGWCECDRCRRVEEEEGGAHSGPVLRFVNGIAEAIGKTHADKLIETFAYSYTLSPPSHVRPLPNVRVRICPSDACFGHPFEQCPYDARVMRDLNAWARTTNQLYVWHYNINFAHFLLPFPDFDELAADIPMYQRHGVVGLFMEGSTDREGGAEYAELRSYVMARLMWNTKVNVRRTIEEFHETYFGPAAKPMLAYFDLLQSLTRMPPGGPGHHLFITDPPSAPYLGGEFLDRATVLFREAEAAAGSGAVLARVKKARMGIDYVRISRAKRFLVQGDEYRPASLSGVEELWSTLVKAGRGFGMSRFSENNTIDQEDRYFHEFVRSYSVVTLENERLRVHVVPELSGRVTHIIDKASGRNLLADVEPNGTRSKVYPDMGGLTVGAYTDTVPRRTYAFPKWTVAPGASGTSVTLTAIAENGLKVSRTLTLDGSFLRTAIALENGSNAPLEARLESRWEANPDGQETAVARFRNQSGASVERDFLMWDFAVYTGSTQPDGEWRLVNRSGGPVKINRFPRDQVVRCQLEWGFLSENDVAMAVVSPARLLQPGARITLSSDYGTE